MSIILNGTTGITSTGITETADGNVGIGTSSPLNRLTTRATANNYVGGNLSLESAGGANATYFAQTTTNDFYISNGGTADHFIMDSSGRIRMPYQPHARASRNSGYIGGNSVIVFNYADENAAGMYNTSTGRFTAPVAGRYLFAHGMFTENGYSGWLAWRVNGANIATTFTEGTGGYASVAGSIVLSMSAGDYADLYVNGSTYRLYGGDRYQCWATFTFLG